jgi:hypothetical protein
LKQALKILQSTIGSENIVAVSTMLNLADVYVRQGNYARSQLLLKETLRVTAKFCAPSDPLYKIVQQRYNQTVRLAKINQNKQTNKK